MLQSNTNKSNNNITVSQTAKKHSENYVDNDAILQYPFIDKEDLLAMRELYRLYVSRYNTKVVSAEIEGKTIKDNSELIFVALVGFFASQLKSRNAEKLNLRRSTATTINHLDDIEIRADHFAKHTIEVQGEVIERFSFSERTIRRHLTRLHEAGVITKRFRGTKLPVKISINPQILQISDADPNTGQKTQTLALQGRLWTNCPNSIDYTSIYLKNNKRKEISIQNLSIKEFSQKGENEKIANAQTPAVGFTRTPGVRSEKSQTGARKISQSAEFYNVDGIFAKLESEKEAPKEHPKPKALQPISAKLISRNDKDNYQLAQLLSSNKFTSYIPINLYELERELMYGNLTIAEFKRVLLVDFAKTASKLWRSSTVYPGSWVKALHELEKYFNTATGNYKLQKEQLVRIIVELRYRINYAIRWFSNEKRKNKINPLFPNEYFDVTRKSAKEVGFRYTQKRWKQHREYLSQKHKSQDVKKQQRKKNVDNSKYAQMWKRAIKRYEKGEYTSLDRLYEYVKQSLPVTYRKEYEYYVLALSNTNKYLS